MAFAFGHLIGAWISGKFYELIRKKKISHYTWGFLLLGGILPDMDYLLDWTFGFNLHRTFTHSFLFVICISLIVYLIFKLLKNKSASEFAMAIGTGIFIHLMIDFVSPYGVPLLWPLSNYMALKSIHFPKIGDNLAILDMALGTAWIFYLWFRKKIEF